MCTYEIVVHRLVVCTKKQCVLKIELSRPIRTLLLYKNLRVSTCAWDIDVVVYNDISMTYKSSVCKCYLQYEYSSLQSS